MKNCPKRGCENVTDKKHCKSATCNWYFCPKCEMIFNPENLKRMFKGKCLDA